MEGIHKQRKDVDVNAPGTRTPQKGSGMIPQARPSITGTPGAFGSTVGSHKTTGTPNPSGGSQDPSVDFNATMNSSFVGDSQFTYNPQKYQRDYKESILSFIGGDKGHPQTSSS